MAVDGKNRDVLKKEEALELLFADIFASYEQPLYLLALKLTKSDIIAQDILQDVFLKLWDLRHTIHEIENIEKFLFKITRNRIIDFIRKTSAEERLKLEIWNSMKEMLGDETDLLERSEFHTAISKAIDQLPPKRKEIWQLKEEGLNYQQIAEQMKISRHTVKHQISSALRSIRTYISSGHK